MEYDTSTDAFFIIDLAGMDDLLTRRMGWIWPANCPLVHWAQLAARWTIAIAEAVALVSIAPHRKPIDGLSVISESNIWH